MQLHYLLVVVVVSDVSNVMSSTVAAGSTHTRSTASNLEQVANLLCA